MEGQSSNQRLQGKDKAPLLPWSAVGKLGLEGKCFALDIKSIKSRVLSCPGSQQISGGWGVVNLTEEIEGARRCKL